MILASQTMSICKNVDDRIDRDVNEVKVNDLLDGIPDSEAGLGRSKSETLRLAYVNS